MGWTRTDFRACKLCCVAVVFTCCGTGAQPPAPLETDPGEFVRELFPILSDDTGASEKQEALFQSLVQPLDLNLVTRDELSALTFLSVAQLSAFFAYRREFGPFLSLYELQAIPEFDLADIRKVLPFVSLEENSPGLRKGFRHPTQHYLMFRAERLMETQKGFTSVDTSARSSSRYVGKPWQWYGRFRYARPGRYSFGITAEKDAGERLNWKPSRQIFGADFTSFHAQIQNRGKLKNFIIGDFQMQAGQGLVMAAGFSLGKGAEVITSTYRSTLGLRPYTSVMEAGYFRGLAATVEVRPGILLTGFLSSARRDATLDVASDTIATSLSVAGLHRTATERAKQANTGEQNVGLHIGIKGNGQRFQLGASALYTHFSTPLLRKPYLYNLYEFSGKENFIAGVHGDAYWKVFHFSAEIAASKRGGMAGVAGVIAALTKTLDVSFLLRKYDVDFHSFYGNSFGEASRPINESGAYWGIRFAPNKRWVIGGYYDDFSFPWLKYLVNAPSSGFGGLGYLRWAPQKRTRLNLMVTMEQKEKNSTLRAMPVIPLVNTVRKTVQLNFEHEKPLKYSVRTRVQGTGFKTGDTGLARGFAVAQDLTYRLGILEVSGRLSYFNTENYDSRQFIYEKDVMYSFSLPSFQGKGVRYYLMSRVQLRKDLKFWIRWAQSRYANQETVGSGLDEIQGRRKSELKMQIMYQL